MLSSPGGSELEDVEDALVDGDVAYQRGTAAAALRHRDFRIVYAGTFSSNRSVAGPYAATLELRPHSGGRAVPAGHDALTATQGAFRLHHGQPLSVYWEWRAGAMLPPGVYTVHVRLRDVTRQVVTSGTAPASLVIVRHP